MRDARNRYDSRRSHTPYQQSVPLLLAADKASKFPSAFPLQSKQPEGVTREPLQFLCLTARVPKIIRCDRGKELGATVIPRMCRWLKAGIQLGPAEHPQAQGSLQRLGDWIQGVLSEFYSTWSHHWDDCASPACWEKGTLLEVFLLANMSPSELFLGRKPRTTLDTLAPLMNVSDQGGRLDTLDASRSK